MVEVRTGRYAFGKPESLLVRRTGYMVNSMALGSSSVCVALLFGAVVVSQLQLHVEGADPKCGDVEYVSTDDIFITIEEECLKGAIEFNAIESETSIPENFDLEFVSFDVYCNTSEGDPLELKSTEFDEFDGTTIDLPAGAAVCRTVVCYRIRAIPPNVGRENYLLTREPVCDYTAQCPSLDNPPNGEVSLHNTSVFSEVNYSCNHGFVIANETTRECQIGGSWSGSEPTCFPMNLPLEVTLDVDTEFPIVGSVVNLTCSGNGTPPLEIEFYRDSLLINQEDLIATESGSAVMQEVLPWEVSETGHSNFTCVVRNSTSDELESSIVQVTGVVRRYIQICFELPPNVPCNNFSSNFLEVLPSFASELRTNCSCIAPDSFELQILQSTCNASCPQQLFYSMSVLTESETELNTTLREWLSLHDSIMAAGIELVLDPACAPLLAATVPSPVCSPSVPTTSQTASSTVPSEGPPSEEPPRQTPTASTTDSSDSEESSDPVVVFVAVFVLVATFVLLTLTLVIMLFFFHKRRKAVSDFAVEGCELPMYDPMQQLDQQGFEQQKQEPPSVNDNALQKSMEVAQTTTKSTSNGHIP